MYRRPTIYSLLGLVLVLAASNLLPAASPVIGVATARGSFRVNDANVSGNATLFDGSLIETARATPSIRLENGATVQLSGESRSRIYANRMILERGQGELSGSYSLEALGLKVAAASRDARGRVSLTGSGTLEVASLAGDFRVTNRAGFLVGSIGAGRALAFAPQSGGAAAPSTLTGCLTSLGGRFYLDDEVSGVKVELTGTRLEKETGNRVEVVGSAIAGQRVQVNTIKQLNQGCAAKPAAAAATGKTAGAAGKAAGMSAGTKAVIAGVAVAAAAGTTAGVYTATADDKPASSR